MDFFTVKSRFENNYLLKLIRSQHGALFLSFIYREFKENHIVQVNFHKLSIKLVLHLEESDYDIPEKQDIEEYSKHLIETWCQEDYQLLRRYYNPQGEIIVELTTHSERGIRWIEELAPKEFVGTESLFSMIFNMLKDLVSGSSDTPEKRIKDLKEERKRINQEIKEIEETGEVESLDKFQIKERFMQISSSARMLLSEFQEVDNNFRKLVQEFYIKGLQEESKGDILGATLDGYSELMNSPQGRSFSGFWQFLIADIGNDKINEMVSDIYASAENLGLNTDDRVLFNLKNHLYLYGEKIVETNHRLAEKLNRILSDPKRRDNKRMNSLIQDIKTAVFQKEKIKDSEFITIDGIPNINLVNERPLQLPEADIIYEKPDSELGFGITDLSELFSLQSFERDKIEKNIKLSLNNSDRILLSEIVTKYPVEYGVEEIVTYFDIVSNSDKYTIVPDSKIRIRYEINKKIKEIEVPEVLFCR